MTFLVTVKTLHYKQVMGEQEFQVLPPESDTGRGNEMFVAKVGLKASTPSSEWIIDSGANHYMTFEKNILQQYRE